MPGEDGKDGKDGADFLSGDGVPSAAFGKPGDFYFDKTGLAIFGPKTDNGWGSPVSLKVPEQEGVRTLFKYNARFGNLEIGSLNSYCAISTDALSFSDRSISSL